MKKMMRKVLFLMFLLLLTGLGAAGVKAQVRIGGNTPPNPAATLDLNVAEGTTTGTKGLALPRVSLASNTATLDGTTANINGMLVYNTSGSLSTGVYYWNGTNWNRVVASTSGQVDSSMLAPAPKNGSTLIYANGSWHTAIYGWGWVKDVAVVANVQSNATVPSSSCISPGVLALENCTQIPLVSMFRYNTTTVVVVSNLTETITIGELCWHL